MKVIFLSVLLFGLAWGATKVPAKGKTTPKPAPQLSCECGKRNTGRIYGGTTTKKNEYPWIAAIEVLNVHICGGSVITERHILTAAHCIGDYKAQHLEVVLGGHNLSIINEENAQRLKVQKVIAHEKYSEDTQVNDIAIFVTATKIVFNQYVGPVCMPTKPMKSILKDQVVKAMGWGLIEKEYTVESVQQLRELDLNVVDEDYCEDDEAFHICTRLDGKDVCIGDSGGPMVWLDPNTKRFTQVSVVSFGQDDDCGVVTKPGLSTDVSAYLDWINTKISPLAKTCHEI